MINIQYMSDVHLEFQRDGGKSFVASLDPKGVDVLVLAGDIVQGAMKQDFVRGLAYFCERYSEATVLYVPGNHELYWTNRRQLCSYRDKVRELHSNFHWLDRSVVEVKGQRFVGAPLWYQWVPAIMGFTPDWTDFSCIRDLKTWINEAWRGDREFFNQELREGDVAISHFLPSAVSVVPRWQGSSTNAFFLSPMDVLIEDRKPKVWIHGHTHDSVDTTIGPTRIVCNPFGYVPKHLNSDFKDRAVLSL